MKIQYPVSKLPSRDDEINESLLRLGFRGIFIRHYLSYVGPSEPNLFSQCCLKVRAQNWRWFFFPFSPEFRWSMQCWYGDLEDLCCVKYYSLQEGSSWVVPDLICKLFSTPPSHSVPRSLDCDGSSRGSSSPSPPSHLGTCVHFSLKSDTVVNKLFIILSPLQSFSSGGKEIWRDSKKKGRFCWRELLNLSLFLSLSGICPGSVLLNIQ